MKLSKNLFITKFDVQKYACPISKLDRLTYFDRYLFRPISHFFLPLIFNVFRLSPNKLSIISLISALISSILFFNQMPYLGVFFLILWAIIDCADGSLARILFSKYKIKSNLGEFFDAYAGYFVASTIWLNIGNYLFIKNDNINFLYIGIFSSFLAIYSRCSYLKLNLVLLKDKNLSEYEDNSRQSRLYYIYENLEFGSALPILILLSLIINKLSLILLCYLFLNILLFLWLQNYIISQKN